MSINQLLPDPRKVMQNDVDTLFDLRVISLRYQMGKITANEAMEQVDERLKRHDENYKDMYLAFHNALRKGDNNND